MKTYCVASNSNLVTEAIAAKLAAQLRGGEIIELVGDLGSGKTTFTRGFVRGAGSNDRVSSPTFTVSNVYKAAEFEIHHYDFYRLNDFEIIRNELREVAESSDNIVIMEWAQPMLESVERDHLTVKLIADNENTRKITIVIPDKYDYIEVTDDINNQNR